MKIYNKEGKYIGDAVRDASTCWFGTTNGLLEHFGLDKTVKCKKNRDKDENNGNNNR